VPEHPRRRRPAAVGYSHATTVRARGVVMLGDEMIDEASRKMAAAIVARGNAASVRPNR
jgi:citrate lyase subunit beta / citryl-CoA lyase